MCSGCFTPVKVWFSGTIRWLFLSFLSPAGGQRCSPCSMERRKASRTECLPGNISSLWPSQASKGLMNATGTLMCRCCFYFGRNQIKVVVSADLPASHWPGSWWAGLTGSRSAGTAYRTRDWRPRACPLARRPGRPISESMFRGSLQLQWKFKYNLIQHGEENL